MFLLRDYQREALRAVNAARSRGVTRQLIVLPPGTGKTVIVAHLIRMLDVPTLFLVHRDELVWQTLDKLSIVWPEADVGVVKAERDETACRVTVASVQTVSRPERLARLRPDYGLVVTDEAHHSVAPQWRRVLEGVGAGEKGLHLGLTATANRGDRVGLGCVFEEVVYQKTIADMVGAGYLCDVAGLLVRTNVDLSRVRVAGDDFADASLETVVNTANRNHLIAETFVEHAAGRKALVFTAGVKHAYDLAEVLGSSGVAARALDHTTPLDERRRLLADFRGGVVRALVNCGVLTEGYDEPSVDCVVLARPTRSQALYVQMVGRGLRLYPGKRDCLVVDVADNSPRLRLVQLPDLVGREGDAGAATRGAREGGQGAGTAGTKALPQGDGLVVKGVELLTPFSWVLLRSSAWVLGLGRQTVVALVPAGDGYRPFLFQSGVWRALHARPLPLEWAQGVAETTARQVLGEDFRLINRRAQWRAQPATDSQKELLRRLGADGEDLTRGEASALITRLFWEDRVARLVSG